MATPAAQLSACVSGTIVTFSATTVVGNCDYSCECGQGLMRSNAAAKIRSEQAGVLWWLERERGHVTNTCGHVVWRATGSDDRWVQWPAVNKQIPYQSLSNYMPMVHHFLGKYKVETNTECYNSEFEFEHIIRSSKIRRSFNIPINNCTVSRFVSKAIYGAGFAGFRSAIRMN